jgi:hypothetical protein
MGKYRTTAAASNVKDFLAAVYADMNRQKDDDEGERAAPAHPAAQNTP